MSVARAGSFDSLATSTDNDGYLDHDHGHEHHSARRQYSPVVDDDDGDDDDDDDDDQDDDLPDLNQGGAGRDEDDDDQDDADPDHEPPDADAEEEDGDEDGDGDEDDDGDDIDDDDDNDDDDEQDSRPRPSAAARLAAARAMAASHQATVPAAAPRSRGRSSESTMRPSRPRSSRPSITVATPTTDAELWKKAKSSKATPLKDALERIVVQAGRKDVYSFFAEPVDTNAVPMYRSIISHPMDFGTIRTRIQNDHYTNVADFEQDLMLVFNNAMTFNPPDSPYHQSADRLARWAERAIPRETQYAVTPAEQQVLDRGGKDSLAAVAPGAAALAAAQAQAQAQAADEAAAVSDDDGEGDEDEEDGPPSTRAATPVPNQRTAAAAAATAAAATAAAAKPRRSYRSRQSAAMRPAVTHTHPVPLQFLSDGSIDPTCGSDVSLIPHPAAWLGSNLIEAQLHPNSAVRDAVAAAECAAKTWQPRSRAVQAVPVDNLAEVASGTGSSARTMALYPPRTGYKTPSGDLVDVKTHVGSATAAKPFGSIDTEWPPLRPDTRGTQPAANKNKRKGNVPVHLPTRIAGQLPETSKTSAPQYGLQDPGDLPSLPLRWPAVDPGSLVLGRKPASALSWPLSWAAVTAQPSRQLGAHDVGLGGTWIPGSTALPQGILPNPNLVRGQGLHDAVLEQLGTTATIKASLALPSAPSDAVPDLPTLASARSDPRSARDQIDKARTTQDQNAVSSWASSLAPAVPADLTHSMWTNMYRSYRPAVASVLSAGESATEALQSAVYGGVMGEAYLRSIARFVNQASRGVQERWGRTPDDQWETKAEEMKVSVEYAADLPAEPSPQNEEDPSRASSLKRPRSESVLSERGTKKMRLSTTPATPQIKVESDGPEDAFTGGIQSVADPTSQDSSAAPTEPESQSPPAPVPTYASSLGVPLVAYVRDTVADPLTQGCLSILDEVAAGFSILAGSEPMSDAAPSKQVQAALSRTGVTQAAIEREEEEARYWANLSKELDGVELGPEPPAAQAAGMARTPSAPGVAPLGLATATALAASFTDPSLRMRRDELSRLLSTRMDVNELLRTDDELKSTYTAAMGKKVDLPPIKAVHPSAIPPAQAELSLPLTGGGLERSSAASALDAAAKIMLDLGARRAPTEADRTLWLDSIRRTLVQASIWGCPAADTRAPVSHEVVNRVLVNQPIKKDVDAVLAQAQAAKR